MKAAVRIIALTVAAALAAGSSLAQGRRSPGAFGGHAPHVVRHHGHAPHHPFRGGFAFGLGLGVASHWVWGWPYDGWYYGPPPVVYEEAPIAVNAPPLAPETIYDPRLGQSDAQRETDLRECNRWATTQPAAMAEAAAFQRAVLACMDGRGYSGR